jgi:hypothetical protein
MNAQTQITRFASQAILTSAFLLGTAQAAEPKAAQAPIAGKVEVVAQLPIRPGNVAATKQGRVFATVHPLDKPSGVQLIEITSKQHYRAWPSKAYQNDGKNFTDDRIDSPLGIYRDSKQRIWIVDMGLHVGKTRIWGFDIRSGKLVKRIDLPTQIAPAGSFVQDLVVDDKRGWIYLADIADPGLIAVNIATGKARRFGKHYGLQAEPGVKMIIDGKQIHFNGKPAEVAVDPITLSADKETIYFGAMNGRTWYSVPTRLFREGASDAQIAEAIAKVGRKPISDGAATDTRGNHFFTNLTEHGIDVLTADGKAQPFVRDARMVWPDGVQFGSPSWLYVSVNQLNTTPAFTGGEDEGKKPYYILRVKTEYK